MTFNAGDIVRVPFPFTDMDALKNRPALVISRNGTFNHPSGHSVMAMITSALHNPWPLDYRIGDLKLAGLPSASIVRFKLFTIDNRLVRGKLGKLSDADKNAVWRNIAELIGM